MLRIKDCNFDLKNKNVHPKKLDKFDQFFEAINMIRMVKLNLNCWELSECNCPFWQKNYKCFHIVLCAYREPNCSFNFDSILLLLPCEKKLKRGAKPKSKPALLRQSTDNTASNELIEDIESDEQDENEPPSKKQKELRRNSQNNKMSKPKKKDSIGNEKICATCNEALIKRNGYFCPNRCAQPKV
jgi:hypothetical protein